MYKGLLFAFVIALFLGSLAPAYAARDNRPLENYAANIYAIDQESRIVTLVDCFTGDVCEYTGIRVTDETIFVSTPQTGPISLTDLQIGWLVFVQYYELNGDKYAAIIRIKTISIG